MKLFPTKKNQKNKAEQEKPVQSPASTVQTAVAQDVQVPTEAPKDASEDGKKADAHRDGETTGTFKLSYEPEGVFMTLACSRPLLLQEQERLVRHLSRKKIQGMDTETVLDAIAQTQAEHVRIAPAQEEVCYNAVVSASVSADCMEVSATLLPPEPDKGRPATLEDVLSELEQLRVTFGIDQEAIQHMLAEPLYDQPQVIARGTPPKPGEDGRLEWHIERRTGSAVYRIRQVEDHEKADYKNLDLFTQVQQDQLLVSRIPPQEGIPGRTVLGRVIPGETGKNYLLPRGKNTYITEDGLQLRAKIAGRVDEVNGSLEVNTYYHVVGDVDMSVGNIDFDGDVVIDGNVSSGFTIKSTGSIEVKGIVEASALEAGGDILILGGVRGGGKGSLQAKDGVSARFAEYVTIQAGSIVSAESLLHSNVSCFGAIEALSGRGSIIGGNICAGTYIAANYLGTSSGRVTELEVGLSPQHRIRLAELEKTAETMKREAERLQSHLDDIQSSNTDTERAKKTRMENVRKLLQCKKMMQEAEEELEELKANLEGSRGGQVHVMHTAYPGVSITIGLARMTINQQITYATFRQTEGDVEFTNCRFKQQPVRLKKRRR